MKDKYYHTTSPKSTVLNKFGLAIAGANNDNTTEQLSGTYFENENIVLLWLAKLARPLPKNNDGSPTLDTPVVYKQNGENHFNVRFKRTEVIETPIGIKEIEPVTPDYVFA